MGEVGIGVFCASAVRAENAGNEENSGAREINHSNRIEKSGDGYYQVINNDDLPSDCEAVSDGFLNSVQLLKLSKP